MADNNTDKNKIKAVDIIKKILTADRILNKTIDELDKNKILELEALEISIIDLKDKSNQLREEIYKSKTEALITIHFLKESLEKTLKGIVDITNIEGITSLNVTQTTENFNQFSNNRVSEIIEIIKGNDNLKPYLQYIKETLKKTDLLAELLDKKNIELGYFNGIITHQIETTYIVKTIEAKF